MPIYSYQCTACQNEFDLQVRSADVPLCPQCGGGSALTKLVALTAPQGKSKGIIASGRAAAAAQGHLSNFSQSERGRK